MPAIMKRPLPEEPDDALLLEPKRTLSVSSAAKLNVLVMRKLQRALEADPEVDLTTAFPMNYSSRLAGRKATKENAEPVRHENVDPRDSNGFFPIEIPTAPAKIVHPLSDRVKNLLDIHANETGSVESNGLTEALAQVLRNSNLIWQSQSTKERYIAKCCPELIIKSTDCSEFTEYTSLQYLELHRPQIPVPRPHGLIISGESAYLFMTFVPGVTLHKVWPELGESQKESVSEELDSIFSDLRQMQRPEKMALGGVAGEGCKDTRRQTRVSEIPLYTGSDFWDFLYSKARGSRTFIEFLNRITSPFQVQKCVFTHGDLRTENIIVQPEEDGGLRVSGIIDWEMSGFYPEDFECIKITNTLASNETDDWYLHLPSCISPSRFPSRWLSDHAWDRHVV